MAATWLAGFGTGMGLIVAIGAQNAFVLRQGLRREHVFAVALFCAGSDAALIALGVFGGAVALAAANRVLMFEHAVYSVISPEGCASILWRTSDKAADAATAMKMSAQDLLGLKVIDRIVPEPVGGAHRAPELAIKALGDAIAQELDALAKLPSEALLTEREEKFLAMGRA